jgi:hypothetical protein
MKEALCFATLKTKTDAAKWVRRATREIGLGFHPDTRAAEYINLQTGLPLFNADEAEGFDEAAGSAFIHLGDKVYEQGLAIQQSILRGAMP